MYVFITLLGVSILNASGQKSDQSYCSFFDNRAPEQQKNLSNCTWFSEQSCCRENELQITFAKMKPLPGASPECVKYLNYLMCYICSPEQYLFYKDETLRVCENFCDEIFEVCRNAVLKGSTLYDAYENGAAFCKSRNFQVIKYSEDPGRRTCFNVSNHHMRYVRGISPSLDKSKSMILLVVSFLLVLI